VEIETCNDKVKSYKGYVQKAQQDKDRYKSKIADLEKKLAE